MKASIQRLWRSIPLLSVLTDTAPVLKGDGTNTNVIAMVTITLEEPNGFLKNGDRLPGLFEEHLADRLTNRVTTLRFLRHLMREDFQPTVSYSDRGEDYFRGAVLDGASRALRDWFLEEIPIASVTRGEIRDILLDAISGNEERGILRSPFHQDEGIYTWDELEGRRGLQLGLRPLRSSPYGYLGYYRRYYTAHLRYYYTDFERHRLEVLLRFPLVSEKTGDGRWEIHLGYQFDWNHLLTTLGRKNGEQGDIGRLAAGLGGEVFGGNLFLGGYVGRERPLAIAVTWRRGL